MYPYYFNCDTITNDAFLLRQIGCVICGVLMKLTMLGTGNALVTNCYNTCFVLEDNHQYLLVDGGGGSEILARLKHANIELASIHDVFVTHKHIDHLMGIVWVIRVISQLMNKNAYDGNLNVYAHAELISLIEQLCQALLATKQIRNIGQRIQLIPIKDGESRKIINHTLTFFDIHSTKAKQFGFIFSLENGRKLVCCGDEPCPPECESMIENADWLLHEAFCLHTEIDIHKPYEKNHSTVRDACQLAQRLNIKNLVLYHTEDSHILMRKVLYINEGTRYYHGRLFVPDDMECIII